jgi:hypothetical protein
VYLGGCGHIFGLWFNTFVGLLLLLGCFSCAAQHDCKADREQASGGLEYGKDLQQWSVEACLVTPVCSSSPFMVEVNFS